MGNTIKPTSGLQLRLQLFSTLTEWWNHLKNASVGKDHCYGVDYSKFWVLYHSHKKCALAKAKLSKYTVYPSFSFLMQWKLRYLLLFFFHSQNVPQFSSCKFPVLVLSFLSFFLLSVQAYNMAAFSRNHGHVRGGILQISKGVHIWSVTLYM